MAKIKGIDVSEHQGKIDWNKVKASGVKYAILRCGYGSDFVKQDDATFKRNADECTRLGIPFGVYLFSYANTLAKAKSEAEHTLRVIKEYKLDYPVFYDLEDNATTGSCSKKLIGDMAEAYCDKIKAAGYHVGVYASASWFNSILTDKRFDNYDKWVAQYNYELEYKKPVTMWQYSSKGKVNGINGGVDMNYCYVDYPSIINNVSSDHDYFKPVETEKEDNKDELGVIEHIVKKGDTLTDIALKYQTTVAELVEMNKIQNANIIHVGDVIKIATMTDAFETPVNKSVDEITPEVMAGKWKQNKNGWWYEYNDGTYPKDQWLKLKGSWYYFKPNGYAVCDDWYNVKDKWYYFDDTCRMVTGLRQIGDETYYFADDGHMCRTNNRGALV